MQRGHSLRKRKRTKMGCICIQQCHPSEQYKWKGREAMRARREYWSTQMIKSLRHDGMHVAKQVLTHISMTVMWGCIMVQC